MSERQKTTISASEIVNLINPSHPTGDTEAARLGKIEHKRVIGEITAGIIPRSLKNVVFDLPIESATKPSRLEIENGLWMTVTPDLNTPTKVFELKSQARELRYFALQLAIGCMIKDVPTGILFFYHGDQAYQLNNGASQCWEVIKTMGIQARRIYDIQERVDNLKRTPVNNKINGRNTIAFETTALWEENGYSERISLGFEACELRKRFDMNTQIVFRSLQSSITRLN